MYMPRLEARISVEDRKGGLLVLACVSMLVLLVFCLFSIDIAYIQLVRTELRTATDAASIAGCEALARNQNRQSAIDAAVLVGGMNTVAGQPLNVKPSDVQIGIAIVNPDTGVYEFSARDNDDDAPRSLSRTDFATPLNPAPMVGLPLGQIGIISGSTIQGANVSLQAPTVSIGSTYRPVTATQDNVDHRDLNSVRVASDRRDVLTLSGSLFMFGRFSPTQSATSTNTVRDIALVLDRSGSMRGSRMRALQEAVESFVEVLEDAPTEIRCSLTTYATTARKEVNMTSSLSEITYESGRMRASGMTNIGGGLKLGTDSLRNDPDARPYSSKAIVLMTDGRHNSGTNPNKLISTCVQRGHPVYTITFGAGANKTLMKNIASKTGGKHFHAQNSSQLIDVFEDIANALAIVLIQ